MVEIEEVTNDDIEEDVNVSDDEAADKKASRENKDRDDDELDFTKSISKEELLGDIKAYNPAELQDDCSECEDCDGEDEPVDYFDNGAGSSNLSQNMGSKRAIALIVLFPMVATGIYMVYEVLGRFKIGKSSMQMTAAIGGAVIAMIIMSNVAALKSAVKFVFCFAWIVFLYPTYQVYQCSPVLLKNDMLGTWFSLNTEASKFLELSYVTSECFQSYQLHSPYMLSLISLKVSLTVDISDLINLNPGDEKGRPLDVQEGVTFHYFLLVTKRSVKKKFHKLHMIVEAAPKLAETLQQSLKLNASEKEKKLLYLTGGITDVDDAVLPMKKELEGYKYLMRPIKFKVYNVKYIDRYAKLKNRNDGYY